MRKLLPLLILVQMWPNLYLIASPATGKRRVLHYGPEKVRLTGKVVSRTFYGPPNYGENPRTDSRESQYILLLDSAIDIVGTKDDPMNQTERGVTKITLVIFDFKAHPVESLLGRRVEVEGTLFHANTGHHHTKVLIQVSSIKKARLTSGRLAQRALAWRRERTWARLTTHSTGAELAWLLSSTWMPFADNSRPVNSGVSRRILDTYVGSENL